MSPPDRSNAIPHELLLGQAGFLRRLARDLVGDPHAAEDAVQDVMLTALERPPRHDTNIHGWLAAVLKNLVSKRSRAHVRRTHHEQEAARTSSRGGSVPAESESTVRSVTAAVLALEEPYRSTVLMRYFEELTPSAIAERQAVSVATVKSRLQRALELLRARMKREQGSNWANGLVALLAPGTIGKGVVLVSLKTKLAIGTAVVLAGWFLVHQLSPPEKPTPEALAGSGAPQALVSESQAPPKPALAADSQPPSRTEGGTVASASAAAEDLPDTLLMGSLLDATGKPIRSAWSAWCSVTDENGVRLNCDAKSGGAFIFTHIGYGRYRIAASAFGFRMAFDSIELTPGAAQVRKDIRLVRQPLLRIRATTPDGKPLRKALGIDSFGNQSIRLVPVATRERPGPMINEVVGSLNNPFGIGHFWQYGPLAEHLPADALGIVLLEKDPPAYISLLNWHAVLQTKEVQPGDEEVLFVLKPEDVLASTATIRVLVLDSDGQTPLQGAGVILYCGGEDEARGGSGPDGIANLEKIVPAEGELVISAKDHARQTLQVSAKPGVVTDLGQVVLDQGLELHALVLDADGKPVSANFQLHQLDRRSGQYRPDPWGRGSGADGELVIPNLGRELYQLRTVNISASNDQDPQAAKLVCAPVPLDLRSGVAPSLLRIQLVPASRLTLVLRGEDDEYMRFRVTDAQGSEILADRFWWLSPYPLSLPPGSYTVELLTPERAVLAKKSVTLGTKPITLELSR